MIRRLLSIISFFVGLGFIAIASYIITGAKIFPDNVIAGVFHPNSFAFISFMLAGLLLISHGVVIMWKTFIMLIFQHPSSVQHKVELLNQNLKAMSDAYYAKGASGLRSAIPFKRILPVWKLIIQQLETKIPIGDIQELLDRDSMDLRGSMNDCIRLLNYIGSIAPSLGVLGTVLGLIKLLANMKDMATIGPNMSLALMTTLYGLFFSTVVAKPLIVRLEAIRAAYLNSYRQAIFWLDLIESKKPTFYIETNYVKNKVK